MGLCVTVDRIRVVEGVRGLCKLVILVRDKVSGRGWGTLWVVCGHCWTLRLKVLWRHEDSAAGWWGTVGA